MQTIQSGWQQPGLPVPPGFALLCNVLGLTIDDVLTDFMRAVAGDSFCKSEIRKKSSREYFIQCNYAHPLYSREELESMLAELQSISLLWPEGADRDLIDLHVAWRKKYWEYWIQKWKARAGQGSK